MEAQNLSRKHLETLTNQQLISLADEYGIDIPINLDRRFIIGELLEYAEEQEENFLADSDVNFTDEEVAELPDLPKTYNETKICAVLRDPVWVYTFWDISSADLASFENDSLGTFKNLILHVSFYDNEEDEKQSDSIDIQVALHDRSQYVLLSSGKKVFSINLEACYEGRQNILLAKTGKYKIPSTNQAIASAVPGSSKNFSPLVKLSGMEAVLRKQYLSHRELFAEL